MGAAAETARRHGVSATAVALGLNATRLKERAAATVGQRSSGAFVPLAPLPWTATAACVVEVEDGRGRRLRVELGGASVGEAAAVARALWVDG